MENQSDHDFALGSDWNISWSHKRCHQTCVRCILHIMFKCDNWRLCSTFGVFSQHFTINTKRPLTTWFWNPVPGGGGGLPDGLKYNWANCNFYSSLESVLAMFTFDSMFGQAAFKFVQGRCSKYICVNIANLCIPDSEEIDPVHFEKVNLGERLGTYPGDRTISKQETFVYQCSTKFGTKLKCLSMTSHGSINFEPPKTRH